MPATWRPATRLTALRTAGIAPAGVNPTVACACGRRTNADMLVDVRALPAAVRARLPHGSDFACDGCTSRLLSSGTVTPAEFARHLGAPPDVVARLASLPQGS